MRQCTITLPSNHEKESSAEGHSQFIEEVVELYGYVNAVPSDVFTRNSDKEVIITEAMDYSFPVDELRGYHDEITTLVRKYAKLLELETVYVVWPNGTPSFV